MTWTLDVVVIGAGIGGLTAGALAAHDGLDTLVLEAHNRPGGCAGDFALDGLLFPAGATLLSGFEPGGLQTWVYRHLDIAHRAAPLDQAMEIVGADRRFTLWTDRQRWEEELDRAFPSERAARRRFLGWAERVGGAVHRMAGRLPVLPPRAPRDVLRLALALRPETLRTLPYLPRTVGGVMRSLGADGDAAFRQLIMRLAEAALRYEAAPPGVVGIVIADDETVRDLNREYRGIDEPTDVLSFGLGGLAQPAVDDEALSEFVVPEGLPVQIGEIVISAPYAARTAAATNRPVRDEIALLVVHGVLHLLDHDHHLEEEGGAMRGNEAAILAEFGIERGSA